MITRSRYLLIGSGALAATFAFGLRAAASEGSLAQIAVKQGRVVVLRGDRKLPAEAGTSLRGGDALKTDGGGRAKLLLADGSVVNVGEATKVTFRDFALDGDTLTSGTLALEHGALHVYTVPASFKKLGVLTPTARVSSRSADYLVKESVQGAEVLCVSGDVALSATADEASKPCVAQHGTRCTVSRAASVAGAPQPADEATVTAARRATRVTLRLAYRSQKRAKFKKSMLRARAAFSQGKKAKARPPANKSGDVNSLLGGAATDPLVPPLSNIRVTGRVPTSF